ncbi:MAG TPA: anti-sigma factor, partial [Roseiflexaceae bacterium]|nr:anti-sigma factor [Roseiflexaceae bacterium]
MTAARTPQLNDEDLELLSAYIDSRLSAAERAALEERLSREPALRAILDELRATVSALRSLEPARPPRSFTLDPAQVRPRAGPFSLFTGLLPLAGPLVAVLVCAVLAVTVVGRGGLGGAPAAA